MGRVTRTQLDLRIGRSVLQYPHPLWNQNMDPIIPDFHHQIAASWAAMGEGAPMLAALAGICARAVLQGPQELGPLQDEEQAILFMARDRGVIEVRGVHTGFEAPMRFLAVYVENAHQERLELRNRFRPEVTVRFFEAFCRLCRRGLILHHLHHDFSLSGGGYDLARTIDESTVAAVIESLNSYE